jgi:hypothetical protein
MNPSVCRSRTAPPHPIPLPSEGERVPKAGEGAFKGSRCDILFPANLTLTLSLKGEGRNGKKRLAYRMPKTQVAAAPTGIFP